MKRIITIIVIFLLLFKPITVYAQDIDGVFMPNVGISEITSQITEDQARWAYAKELGEQQLKSEELRLMSAIIWCEAGNQCDAGKQAVGIVVMNRVDDASFEDTVEDVIYEKGQFRPKTDGRLNQALKMYDEGTLPWDCISAGLYALSGETTVTYNGVEIDMSEYLYFATHWVDARLTIQDHDFK